MFNEFNRFLIHPINEIFFIAKFVFFEIQPTNRLVSEYIGPEVGSVTNAFDFASDFCVKPYIRRANFKFRVVIFVAG